jgi:chaperone protein EcpD
MLPNKIGATLITLALGMASFPCASSVVVSGTRVVYSLAEKEQTVRLTNDGKEPSLVQIWIDDGDVKATPNTAKAPFLVSPPISRIDPNKGQSIRLLYTGEPVPQDVESIYYFNLLEIPPKPSADKVSEQFLQFAFRTRIKLFLRPPGLEGAVEDAPEKITWEVSQRDSGWEVVAKNPTPYHVTFIKVELKSASKTVIASDPVAGMVDPRGAVTFKLKSLDGAPASWATLEYRFVNDHGGVTTGEIAAPK